jgi:hypothetical protein
VITAERAREVRAKLAAIAAGDTGTGIVLRPPDEGGDPSVTIRTLAGFVGELLDDVHPPCLHAIWARRRDGRYCVHCGVVERGVDVDGTRLEQLP